MLRPYSRSVPRSAETGFFPSTAATEKLAEDIAKATASGAASRFAAAMLLLLIEKFGKIEAAEIHSGGLRAILTASARTSRRNVVGIEAVLIVNLPLLGVAQDIVGFLDLLELLLGGFVAGIQIRVILSGQFAVSLSDLIVLGSLGDAQKLVIILFG